MTALPGLSLAVLIAGAEVLMGPRSPEDLPRASADVAAFIASYDSRLNACMQRLHVSDKRPQDFLYARAIKLNRDEWTDYVVLPSRECSDELMGTHALSYWLLAGRKDGKFRVVCDDAEDEVLLLDASTKGFRDLEVHYSLNKMRLQFNGKEYEEADF